MERFTKGELDALMALIDATQEDTGWEANYAKLQANKHWLTSAYAKLQRQRETQHDSG